MTFEGTLAFVDLGSGQWVLHTDGGARHPLIGDVPAALAGRRVLVEGRLADAFGFGLTSDRSIEVRTIKAR